MIENPNEISARGTDPAHEHKIRQRAHDLWEREGRPEHRAEAHWHQAEREIADEEGIAAPDAPEDVRDVTAGPAKSQVKAEKEPKRKAAKEPKAKQAATRRERGEARPQAANA